LCTRSYFTWLKSAPGAQKSRPLTTRHAAIACAEGLPIEVDGGQELGIFFVEPRNFLSHRLHQLNQVLVFVE